MPENELAQRFLEKAKQDLRVLEKWRGDAEIPDEEDDEPLDRDDVFTLLNQLSAWVERQLLLPVDDQIEAPPQSNLQLDSKEDAHNNDTV